MATLSPVLRQATPVVVDHAVGSWIHANSGFKAVEAAVAAVVDAVPAGTTGT